MIVKKEIVELYKIQKLNEYNKLYEKQKEIINENETKK